MDQQKLRSLLRVTADRQAKHLPNYYEHPVDIEKAADFAFEQLAEQIKPENLDLVHDIPRYLRAAVRKRLSAFAKANKPTQPNQENQNDIQKHDAAANATN